MMNLVTIIGNKVKKSLQKNGVRMVFKRLYIWDVQVVNNELGFISAFVQRPVYTEMDQGSKW